MKVKKILVVEDDENIRKLVKMYFEKSEFQVVEAKDGREALAKFSEEKPQLIILDLMIPFKSGEEVAREIRKVSNIPILMLTAKADEENRVQGLEIGADDYVTKPFSPRELVLRVKNILRRTYPDEHEIKIKDLEIIPKEMRVIQNGKEIELTTKEFKVLYTLAKKSPLVLSREELMNEVYDEYDEVVYDRTIDAYIKNIRKKLNDDPKNPKYIESVYGAGYRMLK
ncbi:response regulator transcription factor [Caldisericum exile]|uniref:OmpR family two-component system response regulator n=1 Tax=Caldisericum exile (strain DSM 21853 / NBRC 104410 / AZM16c01) TaxID=511051 RepID=A0A7U6GEL3_CALEA|nr:OmpR family two-component system response regulator [Caldisericum exile AZM16c01]